MRLEKHKVLEIVSVYNVLCKIEFRTHLLPGIYLCDNSRLGADPHKRSNETNRPSLAYGGVDPVYRLLKRWPRPAYKSEIFLKRIE
jgi:hypothetical protein